MTTLSTTHHMNSDQALEHIKHLETHETPLKIERYRWPNGLELIYQPDHNAPLLSYQTWVRVGSADEREGQTGIAHLFEHLMFKGTPRYPEGELDRLLEEVGGEVNAATWFDWTYYYVDLPSAHLERVIELEADRLVNLTLNESQLEAEREVVMNERRECVDDDPQGVLDEALWSLAMGERHPYGHSTIGAMRDIERISLEECRAFYRQHYAPNQVTLVVCGAVERDDLLKLIDHYYGELSAQTSTPRPRFEHATRVWSDLELTRSDTQSDTQSDADQELIERALERLKRSFQANTLDLEVSAPKLQLGFRVPAITHDAMIALECLDELLLGHESSRLYSALVFDAELASDVYSATPLFRGDALYEIGVDVLPSDDPAEVRALILDELARVARGELSETELRRAQLTKELNAHLNLQTVQQRAYLLGFWSTVTDDLSAPFQRYERFASVTCADIQRVARALLCSSELTTVIGAPITA